MGKTVLVAGASGVVGFAAAKHFSSLPNVDVIALSRREPHDGIAARRLPVDLSDRSATQAHAHEFARVTHLVYAALFEKPNLLAGWREADQIAANAAMFRNLLDALCSSALDLRHVALLQGTKAYGIHVRAIPTPAREDRDESYDIPNFYWEQESELKAKATERGFDWTIFRPQGIFGESFGSAMNVIAALGAYAAILKEDGEPLHYPGGDPNIMEATDSGVLARAIAWAGETAAARGQVYNVTNGDVFRWQEVWPAIAKACGMIPGEARPMSLAAEMPKRSPQWDRIRVRYNLVAPALMDFVGLSFQFADSMLGYGDPTRAAPGIVSTVKIRQAGFTETLDTEEMLQSWFRLFQAKRLLPPAQGD
jgi:nucleoside-diphosphate-sugar epimerase